MPRRDTNTPAGRKAESVIAKERKRITKRFHEKPKTKRLVASQAEFIKDQVLVFKLCNYSNRQIASIVGISRNQVNEMLSDEGEVAKRFDKLQKSMTTAALDLLKTYLVEAIATLVTVMRTSEDDSVRLKAAGEVFDRAGLSKTSKVERDENITHNDGHGNQFDAWYERLKSAPPEIQEQAAAMIEGIEGFLAEHIPTEVGDDADDS